VLSADRLPFDFMLNALRLNDGVPLSMFEARTGLPRTAIAGKLAIARERGWLEPDDDWLRPTELGRRFTNDVIGLFLD
jgi:coproporphyrinogen III oxidase-like Fe-S oxidoreductase